MTEFEAFKAMMLSTLTYMSMTAKDDPYEEGIVEAATGFFDLLPDAARKDTVDAFNEVARDDYESMFNKAMNAIVGAWAAMLKLYENDKKEKENKHDSEA